MADSFLGVPNTYLSGPYTRAVVLTKDDEDVIETTRALYVGGTGNINVTMAGDGVACLISAIPAGAILPIRITQLLSTSTTATLVVALY
jgi:hypothetical protein